MKIGFGNGAFYSLGINDIERFSEKETDLFKVNGRSNAIELNCRNIEVLEYLLNEIPVERFSDFEYISLHAPYGIYQKDKASCEVLDLIKKISEKWLIQNIIIHPNWIKDWEIFLEYQDLSLSLENMDSEEKLGGKVNDLEEIFSKYPFFKFTMDLQHCYCIDPSLKLVDEFYRAFKDRLVEYHLSGNSSEIIHAALFKYPDQSVIINSIPDKNIPIILESCFLDFDEAEKEFNYVLKELK
jgi:hypothetical protein